MTNQFHRIPNMFRSVFVLILLVSCSDSEDTVDTTPAQIVETPVADKLPQVFVNTNGQEIPDEPKIIAEMSIENKGELTYEGSPYWDYRKKKIGFYTHLTVIKV